jgi:hypothetical protein
MVFAASLEIGVDSQLQFLRLNGYPFMSFSDIINFNLKYTIS